MGRASGRWSEGKCGCGVRDGGVMCVCSVAMPLSQRGQGENQGCRDGADGGWPEVEGQPVVADGGEQTKEEMPGCAAGSCSQARQCRSFGSEVQTAARNGRQPASQPASQSTQQTLLATRKSKVS